MDGKTGKQKPAKKLVSYFSYPLLGFLVFYLYSLLDFNYIAKNYVFLVIFQLGFLVIYSLTSRSKKTK